MADLKISQLPSATTPLAGTEVLPIVQSSATKQVSIANLTAGRSVSVADATLTTGNLIIGTSGKGIDFSATGQAGGMTSELLNDYEEGTWTATDQSGASLVFTANRQATYKKVGNQVFAYFDISYPVTANGAASVISLPIANSTFHDAGVNFGYVTYPTVMTGDVARGQAYFYPSTLSGASIPNSALSGTRLIGCAIYETA